MHPTSSAELRAHLLASRLCGEVATTAGNSLGNAGRLLAGEAAYTFGLPDWKDATLDDVLDAVEAAGGRLRGRDQPDGPSGIDPDAALAAIARQHELVAPLLGGGGGQVLVATGHPFALVAHYGAVARALMAAGCRVLRPLEGERHRLRAADGGRCSLRYVDGVACLYQHAGLQHTHLPDYMEAMLAEVGGATAVDLVVADHGFAGAAMAAGVPTVAIADINDPALPLAAHRGRPGVVLVIDDGLEPVLFAPVTEALLGGLS
ncbi:MAG: phosphatase [Acidimicrobiales bacterium]